MFKKMFWVILVAALLLPFSLKLRAQTLPTATPYGQACMTIPTKSGQNYTLRWARLGADYSTSAVCGKVEADYTTSSLIQAYVQRDFGHGFVAGYGKKLAPITELYPGSRGRQLTQPPHMFDGSTAFAIGAFATWTGHGFVARLMQYNNRRFSGAISYRGLSVFGAEEELVGMLFESPWTTVLFHPSIGFGSRPDSWTTVTIQNYWQATKKLRVYAQGDFRKHQYNGLVGVSLEHEKLCFLRLFHEFTEGQRSRWAVEATFAF